MKKKSGTEIESEQAVSVAREAVDVAASVSNTSKQALDLSERLLKRLDEAEEIIREFLSLEEKKELRWREICDAFGGEERAIEMRDRALLFLLRQKDARRSIAGINAKKRITPHEKEVVAKHYAELSPQSRKKTALYRDIAERTGINERRVRTIIERLHPESGS